MFGGKYDLFVKNQTSKPANMYWFVINTIFAIVYLIILILPKTSLKERLPGSIFHVPSSLTHLEARPSFYHYVGFLFALNLIRAIGEIIVFGGLALGYW